MARRAYAGNVGAVAVKAACRSARLSAGEGGTVEASLPLSSAPPPPWSVALRSTSVSGAGLATEAYVGFSDFTSMRPGKERLLPSKGVTPIRGFKPTTASLGLESPRGNTESFYKATTYE